MGYSPRGRKESDTAEQLHFHFCGIEKSKLAFDPLYLLTQDLDTYHSRFPFASEDST